MTIARACAVFGVLLEFIISLHFAAAPVAPRRSRSAAFFLSGSAHVTPNTRQLLPGPWLDAPLTFKPGSQVTRQNAVVFAEVHHRWSASAFNQLPG